MIYFIIMIVFSPFTAVIPAVYAVNLLFRKKLKIEKNYWNIGLFLLFVYSVFSSIVNKDLLSLLSSFVLFLYFALNVFSQNYFVKISRINIVIKYIVYFFAIYKIAISTDRIIIPLMIFSLIGLFGFVKNLILIAVVSVEVNQCWAPISLKNAHIDKNKYVK